MIVVIETGENFVVVIVFNVVVLLIVAIELVIHVAIGDLCLQHLLFEFR